MTQQPQEPPTDAESPRPVRLHRAVPLDADALSNIERQVRGSADLHYAKSLATGYVRLAAASERAQAIADLLASDSELLQEAGLELAVEMGPLVLPPLAALLDSEDARVRWYALEVARHLETADALPMLVQGLADEDVANRWVASHGLERLGRRAFIPVLTALAGREATIPFHRSVRRALAAIRPDEADPLLDSLLDSLDHETTLVQSRPIAVQLLGRTGERRAS